jgi:hypothetical protein
MGNVDPLNIFNIQEVDVAHISDAQAVAIGKLTIAFNYLEFALTETIRAIVGGEFRRTHALVDRLTFSTKVEHLRKQVGFLREDLEAPLATELTAQERAWIEQNLNNGTELVKRLRQANEFRNSVVHCRASPRKPWEHGRLTIRGVEIMSEPEIIAARALEFGGWPLRYSTMRTI